MQDGQLKEKWLRDVQDILPPSIRRQRKFNRRMESQCILSPRRGAYNEHRSVYTWKASTGCTHWKGKAILYDPAGAGMYYFRTAPPSRNVFHSASTQ